MIFKQFFDPASSTFTYLLARSKGAEALIIDPVLERVDEYLKFLGENELKLMIGLDTHVHADHITGLGKLRSLTRCMTMMGEQSNTSLVSRRLTDGDKISIDGIELTALYTPGHTDDSYSFYMPGMVFTGDTLFIRGNGRTDFQNGNSKQLFNSLDQKLFKLPEDTTVWPGHDYKGEHASTIAREKVQNPRYAGKSESEFVDIMDNLNLPNPKMMDVAVPANMTFGDDVGVGFPPEVVLTADQVGELSQYLLVDLRDTDEISKDGSIEGSVHIPFRELEEQLSDSSNKLFSADKVLFFCAYGERSALALELATEKGMDNCQHLKGGFDAWIKAGKRKG